MPSEAGRGRAAAEHVIEEITYTTGVPSTEAPTTCTCGEWEGPASGFAAHREAALAAAGVGRRLEPGPRVLRATERMAEAWRLCHPADAACCPGGLGLSRQEAADRLRISERSVRDRLEAYRDRERPGHVMPGDRFAVSVRREEPRPSTETTTDPPPVMETGGRTRPDDAHPKEDEVEESTTSRADSAPPTRAQLMARRVLDDGMKQVDVAVEFGAKQGAVRDAVINEMAARRLPIRHPLPGLLTPAEIAERRRVRRSSATTSATEATEPPDVGTRAEAVPSPASAPEPGPGLGAGAPIGMEEVGEADGPVDLATSMPTTSEPAGDGASSTGAAGSTIGEEVAGRGMVATSSPAALHPVRGTGHVLEVLEEEVVRLGTIEAELDGDLADIARRLASVRLLREATIAARDAYRAVTSGAAP